MVGGRSAVWGCPLAVVVGALLLACQPVDRPVEEGGAAGGPSDAAGVSLPGPGELAVLRSETDRVAREWQDDPTLVELLVDLGGPEAPSEVLVTYAARDADRILTVTVDRDGISQQRPTLSTLGLEPIPAAALAEVEELPAGTLEPGTLVEAVRPALADCQVERVPTEILYTTGAPGAWDGQQWAEPPRWRVTVLAGDAGVTVHPETGQPIGESPCL